MFYGGSIQSIIQNGIRLQIPLWFNEGLAEYAALGWDTNSDMYVRDAVVNDYLAPIDRLCGLLRVPGRAGRVGLRRRAVRPREDHRDPPAPPRQPLRRRLVQTRDGARPRRPLRAVARRAQGRLLPRGRRAREPRPDREGARHRRERRLLQHRRRDLAAGRQGGVPHRDGRALRCLRRRDDGRRARRARSSTGRTTRRSRACASSRPASRGGRRASASPSP